MPTTPKSIYTNFWEKFLKSKKSNPVLFVFKPTLKQCGNDYISSPIKPTSKIYYTFVVHDKKHLIELTIQENKDESARVFYMLKEKKDEIELAFGDNLNWDGPKEERKRCTIKSPEYSAGYLDVQMHEFIFDNYLDKMSKFIKAMRPYLK